MATGNVAASGTLVASTAQTVTLNDARGIVRVIVRGTAADIFFTVASSGQTPATATVGGTDCYVAPGAVGASTEVEVGPSPAVVSLISTGTPAFTVQSDHPNRRQ